MTDSEGEMLLFDRTVKIQSVMRQYGEENFCISFSGGKDSTVLSELIDIALPGNRIPRVFADTGIELQIIRDFVKKKAEQDDRFFMIKPSAPIKRTLEKEGYPFKSKEHSERVASFQSGNKTGKWIVGYVNRTGRFGCPDKLKYQFTDECKIKISDKCCTRLKEDPIHKWQKENNKPYGILGLMREEGGRRSRAVCLAFTGDKLKNFQPLSVLSKEWEDWFIDKYNVQICDIYKPPYNFKRTGCKGCPFNPNLQEALDVLQEFFPKEREQCEIIWKPVYEEYRRLGYRLEKSEQLKLTLEGEE